MPRTILLLTALIVLLAPASAQAQCPGANPCPYTANSVIGKRAEGVLRFPQAAAVGPDGSVYVADQYTHAIQVFGPDGTFRRELGSAGRGPGGLSSVGAVAVAPDGSVYVADGADRIDRFAPDGSLISSWGSSGSAPGQFRFGAGGGNDSGAGGGIAIGPDGMVYVADTRNDRIQRFGPNGENPVVIVPKGDVLRPQGLAVHGSRLIVADNWRHQLAVFDTGGRLIRRVGDGEGAKPNQFFHPYDVAIDPSGRVYVADNSNHRIVRYGPAPSYKYRARWGAFGRGDGKLQYPRGLAVDPQGRTFVADPGGNRIGVFDLGGKWLRGFGESGRAAGQFIEPLGVAADASGLRAVTDSVNGRVQLLEPDGRVAAMFGAPAPGPTLLPRPVAVAFDAKGRVYVLDSRRSRVIVFNRAGKIIRTIGSPGSRPGQLSSPMAIAIDAAGRIYVADTGNGRIVRYTAGGKHLGSFGRFRTIRGIAVTPDGSRVYGSDAGTHRITVLSGSGADLAEIGRGELRTPGGLALDAAGNIWVADRGNHRVRAFTPDGALLTSFGERGVAPGQFNDPAGVAVDCRGLVTVTDAGNNRVQQFQAAPAPGCGVLPPVQNPPDPILYNQPQPLPPELTVKPTRTSGILAIRQFPVRVSCDLPCRVNVTVELTTRAGKRARATLKASQSLPAGKTVTIRPRLSPAAARRLARALGRGKRMLAEVRVTATTADSAPAATTRRVAVTR
jgi:tripartite motif-containing protein 71